MNSVVLRKQPRRKSSVGSLSKRGSASMNSVVIGFTGRIASGKSTLSALVAESLQMKTPVSFGDYVRSVTAYLGLAARREVWQEVGDLLVKYPEVFCKNVLAQVKYKAGQPLVIEGIRHKEIVEELRRQVAPARLLIVYVHVSEGSIESNLQVEGNSEQEVLELVQHPTEAQVPTILWGLADKIIDNSRHRSPQEVCEEIIDWLRKFAEDNQLHLTTPKEEEILRWATYSAPKGQITLNDEGVAFIDDTRTKVVEVITEAIHLGRDVEEIHRQHPHLSRAQIRAAISYYEEHREEIDADIERRYQLAEDLRQQATGQLTREELMKRRQAIEKRKSA